jgi:molybdenum cofactor biosynthesis enzyme MoaA
MKNEKVTLIQLLDDIGFYTLSEERCRSASDSTPLIRGEIVLTDACNFKCPYCRGQRKDLKKNLTLQEAKNIIDVLVNERLQNLRLSGGEPTIWKGLCELVSYASEKGIKRIAISTNGSAEPELYERLITAGANDFSVSLDACCSSFGEQMSGIKGAWEKVIENIRLLSSLTYTTVGVVVTEETIAQLRQTVEFAASLGVSDIRVISAAQYQSTLEALSKIPQELCDRFPILSYRVRNAAQKVGVRGIKETDSHRCWIAMDDVAIAGNKHFPCIIYVREQGDPIGNVDENMRFDRMNWINTHDTHRDVICRHNCLDCIVQYNNKAEQYHHDAHSYHI